MNKLTAFNTILAAIITIIWIFTTYEILFQSVVLLLLWTMYSQITGDKKNG